MTQTARTAAAARQEQAVTANVAKIEQAKKPSALEVMASRLNISPQGLKNTLCATVFKDANDDQFAALVIVANEYGLNPLTKEIYAFPAKGGITPMVSIDGWIKIMNSHPAFDGIEFTDLPDEKGQLYAIEAVVYRKDRSRPIRVVEYLVECKRNTDPWNKSPARMLRHRALIQGVRYAFGFSGIYADDEVDQIGEIQLVPETPAMPMRSAIAHKPTEVDEETARSLDTGFDPHTGEVITGRADTDHGDQHVDYVAASPPNRFNGVVDDTETPAWQAKVDDWLSRLGSDNLFAPEIKVIETAFLKDRAALPDDIVAAVEGAIAGARKRVGGVK